MLSQREDVPGPGLVGLSVPFLPSGAPSPNLARMTAGHNRNRNMSPPAINQITKQHKRMRVCTSLVILHPPAQMRQFVNGDERQNHGDKGKSFVDEQGTNSDKNRNDERDKNVGDVKRLVLLIHWMILVGRLPPPHYSIIC